VKELADVTAKVTAYMEKAITGSPVAIGIGSRKAGVAAEDMCRHLFV